MKSLAPILLVGYLALVPFCFFGGMMAAPALHADHTPPCAMFANCHEKDTGILADHSDMYFSVTNSIPSFAAALVLVAAALVALLVAAVLSFAGSSRTPVLWIASEYKKVRLRARYRLLSWLALSETSPTFA